MKDRNLVACGQQGLCLRKMLKGWTVARQEAWRVSTRVMWAANLWLGFRLEVKLGHRVREVVVVDRIRLEVVIIVILVYSYSVVDFLMIEVNLWDRLICLEAELGCLLLLIVVIHVLNLDEIRLLCGIRWFWAIMNMPRKLRHLPLCSIILKRWVMAELRDRGVRE